MTQLCTKVSIKLDHLFWNGGSIWQLCGRLPKRPNDSNPVRSWSKTPDPIVQHHRPFSFLVIRSSAPICGVARWSNSSRRRVDGVPGSRRHTGSRLHTPPCAGWSPLTLTSCSPSMSVCTRRRALSVGHAATAHGVGCLLDATWPCLPPLLSSTATCQLRCQHELPDAHKWRPQSDALRFSPSICS